MKRIGFIFCLNMLLLGSLTSNAQVYDDVYDTGVAPYREQQEATRQSNSNTEEDRQFDFDQDQTQARGYNYDEEYIDYDDDEYYYASRIRRFNNSFWRFGYYSTFFIDPFWWDMTCVYPTISFGWGPGWNRWGMNSWGWNNWGWNTWGPGWNSWGWSPGWYGGWGPGWNSGFGWNCGWNSWGCYPGWNNWGWNNWGWNTGFGWNQGFNQGYWNGYWDGFYDAGGGNWGNRSGGYVYGPRSSANSNVRFNRQSIRNTDDMMIHQTGFQRNAVIGVRDNVTDRNSATQHQQPVDGSRTRPQQSIRERNDVQPELPSAFPVRGERNNNSRRETNRDNQSLETRDRFNNPGRNSTSDPGREADRNRRDNMQDRQDSPRQQTSPFESGRQDNRLDRRDRYQDVNQDAWPQDRSSERNGSEGRQRRSWFSPRNEERQYQQERSYQQDRNRESPSRPSMDRPMDNRRMESPRMDVPRRETPRMDVPRRESPRMESPRMSSPRMESPRMSSPRMSSPSGGGMGPGRRR